MEGAAGQIFLTEDPMVVIKRVYKRPGPHRRIKSHRAPAQCKLQAWAHSILTQANGYTALYVPRSWSPELHQYKMERINTDIPLTNEDVPEIELKKFYSKARSQGIFPCDYELYKQPDGRVAMIDFDKFGDWLSDGTVVFPWGQVLKRPLHPLAED
jgi:hypothetical protein